MKFLCDGEVHCNEYSGGMITEESLCQPYLKYQIKIDYTNGGGTVDYPTGKL
jgi:hypothetical protein